MNNIYLWEIVCPSFDQSADVQPESMQAVAGTGADFVAVVGVSGCWQQPYWGPFPPQRRGLSSGARLRTVYALQAAASPLDHSSSLWSIAHCQSVSCWRSPCPHQCTFLHPMWWLSLLMLPRPRPSEAAEGAQKAWRSLGWLLAALLPFSSPPAPAPCT